MDKDSDMNLTKTFPICLQRCPLLTNYYYDNYDLSSTFTQLWTDSGWKVES